jgi:tripartite-type tricarboxylate transporter receptor subunit TctC
MLTRRRVLAASAAGLISAGPRNLPEAAARLDGKSLRIIVGFPPGGNTDTVARIVAEFLRLSYASRVVVENRTGASSRLAVEYVKNATPDGSVLLFTPEAPIALFPHSFRKLNYEPLRDLIPVAPTARSMLAVVIGSTVPQGVRSLSEFLQWCCFRAD